MSIRRGEDMKDNVMYICAYKNYDGKWYVVGHYESKREALECLIDCMQDDETTKVRMVEARFDSREYNAVALNVHETSKWTVDLE
jgi:hypothetical protein